MQRGKPFLVGNQEFAALYSVKPQMIGQWMHRGVLDPANAVIVSGVHYWPLGFAKGYGTTTARPKHVDESVLEELTSSQSPGWMAQTPEELPPIVGQQETIALFGIPSQGTLAMTIASGRFPSADWELSGSRLWLLDTMLAAAPGLRETARSLPWAVDAEVLAALREGRYEGPGSQVLPRGRAARS
ncbi:hypothetical protein [Streptomyces sp. NPDC002845]